VASRESDERPASLGEFSKAAEMAPHETGLNRSDERIRLNGSLLQGGSLESESVLGMQGKLRGPGSCAVYLSVLLPCHNEARILDRCISETVKAIATEFDEPFEVVVVDDGSTDETREIAEAAARSTPGVRVIRLQPNGGKGAALRRAFAETRGELVCFLDGDLDIHPRHVIPFVRLLQSAPADAVVGSKRHPLSQISYSPERRFLSRAYELFIRTLFGLRIRDTQAGIKVLRREVLERVLPLGLVKRYAFDAELLVLAHRLGYRIDEAPIEMKFREKYGSGVDLPAIGRMFLDTLGLFYRLHVTHYYDLPRIEQGDYRRRGLWRLFRFSS